MKFSKRKLTYLALTDLVWYLLITFLFFTSFYAPIADVLKQSYDAIAENTQSLAQTQDPSTSQISLLPHAQLLLTYILFFLALASILSIIAQLIKSKLLYKEPFWLKTTIMQIGQVSLFIILAAFTHYFLYIQFAFPIIPLWLVIVILTAIWSVFFWAIAHSKARVYAKVKFEKNTLFMSAGLCYLVVILTSFQKYELAIVAFVLWLILWNWLQMHIAKA